MNSLLHTGQTKPLISNSQSHLKRL